MTPEILHIAYTTNRNYVSFATISIHSLIESNPECFFHIHILGYELSDEDVENIRVILPPEKAVLTVYPMHKLRDMLSVDVPKSFPIIAYARLFLASVLPSTVERVLYLDGDTIINGDIRKLFHTDLGDNLVGAVLDPIINRSYKTRTGINCSEAYINAGVLLIPLKRWREENIEHQFVEHLKKNNGSVYLFDQGLVNAVCKGRKYLVSPEFDLMTNYLTFNYKYLRSHNTPFYDTLTVRKAINNPIIIHFTGRLYGRPWEDDCIHPYKELFLHHKSMTAYKDTPLVHSDLKGVDKANVFIYRNMPFFCYRIFMSAVYGIGRIKRIVSKNDD